MNKKIVFAICISIATSIGFISGYYFNAHNETEAEIVKRNNIDELDKFWKWFEILLNAKLVISDLDKVNSVNDIGDLRKRYKENAQRNMKYFITSAQKIKKNSPNPAPINELEAEVKSWKEIFE